MTVDTIWALGFALVIFSVFLFLFVSLASICIASVEVYRWAKRGRNEEELDRRDSVRMRREAENYPAEIHEVGR